MSPSGRVLIVDDEAFIRIALGEALRSWGYETFEAGSVAETRYALNEFEPKVVLLDIDLPDGSGLDVLAELKAIDPEVIAIMITGSVDVPHTIAALRRGAHDFIGKPIKLEELRVTLRNAFEMKELRKEVIRSRCELAKGADFAGIIGDSAELTKAIDLARRVAASDVTTILLHGETGTGKDQFAQAIHYASDRTKGSYVAINCAALPATLIESELFGHEKGAFTDAKQRKEGLFEQAQGGTIFLDEIGELELQLQAKLLRVLEEGTFRRVGGLKDIRLNSRIIAASNRDLKRMTKVNDFRADLYYRLSVIQIDLPPLRERGDDVLHLAQYFLDQAKTKRRTPLKGLSDQVAMIFRSYDWPGNVRELRNIIERASILEDGDCITTAHLPADLISEGGATSGTPGEISLPATGIALETVEFELARQAMDATAGNLTKAAKLLHISRDQLRYKLKKSGDYVSPSERDDGGNGH